MAAKNDTSADVADLLTQHRPRVDHAVTLMPQRPLRISGSIGIVADARAATSPLVASGALDWLPDITAHFVCLE